MPSPEVAAQYPCCWTKSAPWGTSIAAPEAALRQRANSIEFTPAAVSREALTTYVSRAGSSAVGEIAVKLRRPIRVKSRSPQCSTDTALPELVKECSGWEGSEVTSVGLSFEVSRSSRPPAGHPQLGGAGRLTRPPPPIAATCPA